METNEAADPFDIGFLGPYAVVQIADALAQLVEHFDRFQGRKGSRAAFHDSFTTGWLSSIYAETP